LESYPSDDIVFHYQKGDNIHTPPSTPIDPPEKPQDHAIPLLILLAISQDHKTLLQRSEYIAKPAKNDSKIILIDVAFIGAMKFSA
jgi:hypothetical protein